ncbi:hypothetical protein F2Q69_00020346 [Brassica cretica]|uniref:Uncharacterized protein n=1 Tax=Brassica cretica TaxID=69181 RepID=A0A8S9QEB7_BRACR|nr:hypothetical protein F2Q69_00020346 [Brassica cretica]
MLVRVPGRIIRTGEEEMWENPTWNAYEDHHQNIPESREWMDQRIDPGSNHVSETFLGVMERNSTMLVRVPGRIIQWVKKKCGRILLGMLMKITTRVFQKYKKTLRHLTCLNL